MKMLKRLFLLARQRRENPKSTLYPPLMVEPEEFARLICSGRVEDLRILARKLSGRPRAHA
jgi:hypothetical protein